MSHPVPSSYYKTQFDRSFEHGAGLPWISTELDSVRAYQFEIHFQVSPGVNSEAPKSFTLAAKKVTGLEMALEAIPVNRVNDKVFYPGRPTPGDMVVTFDNTYLRQTGTELWQYFSDIYDPLTGEMTRHINVSEPQTSFKMNLVEVIQLDNQMTPHASVDLFGVWPTKWSAGEFNYSTNDFHTIDVTFKYDFMQQRNYIV